jgi:hypothetical protein
MLAVELKRRVPAAEGQTEEERDAEVDAFIPVFVELLRAKFLMTPRLTESQQTPSEMVAPNSVTAEGMKGLYSVLSSPKELHGALISEQLLRDKKANTMATIPEWWEIGSAVLAVLLVGGCGVVAGGLTLSMPDAYLMGTAEPLGVEKGTAARVLMALSVGILFVLHVCYTAKSMLGCDAAGDVHRVYARHTYVMLCGYMKWGVPIAGDIQRLSLICSGTFNEWRLRIIRHNMQQHIRGGRATKKEATVLIMQAYRASEAIAETNAAIELLGGRGREQRQEQEQEQEEEEEEEEAEEEKASAGAAGAGEGAAASSAEGDAEGVRSRAAAAAIRRTQRKGGQAQARRLRKMQAEERNSSGYDDREGGFDENEGGEEGGGERFQYGKKRKKKKKSRQEKDREGKGSRCTHTLTHCTHTLHTSMHCVPRHLTMSPYSPHPSPIYASHCRWAAWKVFPGAVQEAEALLLIACPVTAEEEEEEEAKRVKQQQRAMQRKGKGEGKEGGKEGGQYDGGDEESVLAGLGALMLREGRQEEEEDSEAVGDSLVEDVEAALKMVHDVHRADAVQQRVASIRESIIEGGSMADALKGGTEAERKEKLRSLQAMLQRSKGGGMMMEDFEKMLCGMEGGGSQTLRLMPPDELAGSAGRGAAAPAAGGAAAAAAARASTARGKDPTDPTALTAGSVVEIVGLRAAAHLNGSMGRVVQLVPDTGRWRVQLLDGEGREVVLEGKKKSIDIKPVNVRLQGEEEEEGEEEDGAVADVDEEESSSSSSSSRGGGPTAAAARYAPPSLPSSPPLLLPSSSIPCSLPPPSLPPPLPSFLPPPFAHPALPFAPAPTPRPL